MSGKEHCLPDLPLGDLAIAEKRVDIYVLMQIFCALRHARRSRNTLSKACLLDTSSMAVPPNSPSPCKACPSPT